MTFEQMLRRAKGGDQEAITSILLMYRPLLLKLQNSPPQPHLHAI